MSYLSMYRGDDRELVVTASEDLTGAEVAFTARRYKRDEVPVISKTTAAGITVVGTVATITIDAADTVDEAPGALFWDIQITDATGKIHTVATGRLGILEDITHGS